LGRHSDSDPAGPGRRRGHDRIARRHLHLAGGPGPDSRDPAPDGLQRRREEDCDWAIPYLALGLDAFEPDRGEAMRRAAEQTMRRWRAEHAALLCVAPETRGAE